jgi:signal-transduction protein with cAMP-binding, CBS, and nucleotidyltransferase domain
MSLKDLVASMRARGWGFARVRLGEAQHLVTILDVAMFLASSGTLERTSLRLLDIASENVVSVGRDSTVFELMSVMLSRRVRRVVLEGEDYVITDRSILQYLVSNPVLEMLRDNPSKVMDTTIDALLGYAGNPVILSRDTALSVAVRKLVEREPHTVLTEDKRCILTPWDITKLLKK